MNSPSLDFQRKRFPGLPLSYNFLAAHHVVNRPISLHPSLLQIGDTILVQAGETIPVDAVILSIDGRSLVSIDESLVTGESVPVAKSVNESVMGGSKVLDATVELQIREVICELFLWHGTIRGGVGYYYRFLSVFVCGNSTY